MKKMVLSALLLLSCPALLVGCAGMNAMKQGMVFTPQTFEEGKYAPRVANFQFILDASSSMDELGSSKFPTARNVIAAINQSLPGDLDYNGGLRTFGHDARQSGRMTDLVYGMTRYTRDGLQGGLATVKYAGGNSPMPQAISAAGADLKGSMGKSALVIVSDGQLEELMTGAPAVAAKLKSEMGDNLCIYTIAVGASRAGKLFLQQIADAGGCGFATTANALAAPGAIGGFVKEVFLQGKPTPVPAPAPVAAPPRDSDGDGVIDARDKCPGTPKGQMVDADGCPLKLTLHINFDFDKADIKPEFASDLQQAADFIQQNQNVPYILIEGYTDSVGDDAYNQKLSERRAEAVKQSLVEKYGIEAKRLVARGGGETNPVGDNGTEEGRAQNRRVEIVCCVVLPPQ